MYEYEEVPSKRGGTLYLTPDNQHLYRFNKKRGEKVFVYCYHIRLTKDAQVLEKCKAFGELHTETKTLELSTGHNHEPDVQLLKKLKIRQKVLDASSTAKVPLNEAFKDATRGQDGADLVSYAEMYR